MRQWLKPERRRLIALRARVRLRDLISDAVSATIGGLVFSFAAWLLLDAEWGSTVTDVAFICGAAFGVVETRLDRIERANRLLPVLSTALYACNAWRSFADHWEEQRQYGAQGTAGEFAQEMDGKLAIAVARTERLARALGRTLDDEDLRRADEHRGLTSTESKGQTP